MTPNILMLSLLTSSTKGCSGDAGDASLQIPQLGIPQILSFLCFCSQWKREKKCN